MAQHKYLPFFYGAHILDHLRIIFWKNYIFLTALLSHKFMVCFFLGSHICKHCQLSTKLYTLSSGAHLLIKTISEHNFLLFYTQWFLKKITWNLERGRSHDHHKMSQLPTSLQTAIIGLRTNLDHENPLCICLAILFWILFWGLMHQKG